MVFCKKVWNYSHESRVVKVTKAWKLDQVMQFPCGIWTMQFLTDFSQLYCYLAQSECVGGCHIYSRLTENAGWQYKHLHKLDILAREAHVTMVIHCHDMASACRFWRQLGGWPTIPHCKICHENLQRASNSDAGVSETSEPTFWSHNTVDRHGEWANEAENTRWKYWVLGLSRS
jgi:hypothetical protein